MDLFFLMPTHFIHQKTLLYTLWPRHQEEITYHDLTLLVAFLALAILAILQYKAKVKFKEKIAQLQLLGTSILQSSPFTVYHINKNGNILSQPINNLESNTKAKNINQLWHPSILKKIEHAIDECITTNTTYTFETALTVNEQTKWFEIQVVPYTNHELLISWRDITEQHTSLAKQLESEFIFQTIFHNGSNGIGVLNEKLEWINVNNQLANLLQYPKKELLKLKWSSISIPEDLEYDNYIFSKFLSQNNWNYDADRRFVSKSGETIDLNCSILLFHDPLHNTKEFIVTFQDIRIRKEHERALLNTVIETEEREKTNFAQEIHDGLGPILSAIKMYVQWFRKPDAKMGKEEILNDIEKLIEEAQNSTREISFKLSPHVLKNFGLAAAISSYTEKLGNASNIIFTFDIDEPKLRYSETTEVILYRAITECINNTLKYAKASNAKVSIKNISKSDLLITFIDDGIGFNAQKILSSAKGSGLYNIQNRLKSINGECHFLGDEGRGTEIQFILKI